MLPPKKRKTYESRDDSRVTVPKQVKAYVNKAIRNATELKYIDFVISGTASTSGAYTAFLDAIALGTSYNQRVGDHVKFRRMEWDLRVVQEIISTIPGVSLAPLVIALILVFQLLSHLLIIKGAKKLNHSVQYPHSGNNPSNWMFYFQFPRRFRSHSLTRCIRKYPCVLY